MGAPSPQNPGPFDGLPPALALAKSNTRTRDAAGGEAGAEPPMALTLADHSADVAATFRALLRWPIQRRRLARLAGLDDLSDQACDRLAVAAALHDAGKVTLRFQKRIKGDPAAGGGHIGPLWSLLCSRSQTAVDRQRHSRVLEALHDSSMRAWFAEGSPDLSLEPSLMVLSAALAHHGALSQPSTSPDKSDWMAKDGYAPLATLDDLSQRVRRWFPLAFAADEGDALPITPRFTHALAGLMVWADWLGSDTGAFPLMGLADLSAWADDRFAWSTARADEMLRARRLDATARQRRAAALPWGFAGVFPAAAAKSWQPRPLQSAMLALDAAALPPGATLVAEADTGSGKTEAAVALFLSLLRAGRVDGMYFALPTRASAVQIHRRIHALLTEALGDDAPPVGLAVPGYLRVDGDDGVRLPGHRVAWPDGDDARLDDQRWAAAHSSRYLAGPVMVGTIDQLLMGGMLVRQAHLRSTAMLRQLLVIDEVHASDPYMTALLTHVLDQHRAAGGIALLMSATLGAVARARLTDTTRPALTAAAEAPYPSLFGAGAVTLAADSPARTVRLEPQDPAALEDVLGTAIAAARDGARVLILRNTVRDAVATQIALERLCPDPDLVFQVAGRPAPHHARFAAEDRHALDTALEADFGGERCPHGRIAVTTQTAEQSLDIDADLLITDLCPADVLLQRLGRLHRHRWRTDRPSGCADPRALILCPPVAALAEGLRDDGKAKPGAGSGIGTVYGNLLALAATAAAITETPLWTIPTMNRQLVESITHPEALKTLAERLDGEGTRPGVWQAHHGHTLGKDSAHRQFARLVTLDWDAWQPEGLVQDSGIVNDVATRLGARDRRVELPPGTTGAFGTPITALTIPAHLLPDPLTDATPVVNATAEGLTLRVGETEFVYDRMGLRRLEG
ncbi:CRISPR-associated helicase Cas3' [Azospirillum griseum]|uniref:CRISPR-associated helicase Cas3 n=1 Tax=Azospirillum griseum TaxID=2496639 RepID=A0A431VD31_9PROT|nr:CRISPR-associated helicase Cas3' [Azospirillum griseum]RTR17053.1 CRISPR-associated helicase Cas3' [Azospirillum griseum]